MREDEFEIRGKKYVDRNGELFRLACKFRGTRHMDEAKQTEERKKIAAEYAAEVDRLIATFGDKWDYAPNFDEMLPDEYMSEAYFRHWHPWRFKS